MLYKARKIKRLITVDALVTVHYFQFARGYVFDGESHDFWELVYMDKGAAQIGADGQRFVLGEGEIVFHKPGEFHTIWAGGSEAPDIIVISFCTHSPAARGLHDLRMALDKPLRRQLAQIIALARECYTNALEDSHYTQLVPRPGAPAEAEQQLVLHLEALLLGVLRESRARAEQPAAANLAALRPKTPLAREEYVAGLIEEIEQFMRAHLHERITFEQLCDRFALSATAMKRVFREHTGHGAMDHLCVLRMEHAKRLIREGRRNISEIAADSGFSSVHYFSRRFRQTQGMTPTAYADSVMGLSAAGEMAARQS